VQACLDELRSAGELAQLIDLAPASVSEHLKVLRKSGLLELDKRGRFWMYRADPAALRVASTGIARLARPAAP
jgi:DNA-binding transcriptional ArsR family regulator